MREVRGLGVVEWKAVLNKNTRIINPISTISTHYAALNVYSLSIGMFDWLVNYKYDYRRADALGGLGS